MQKRRNLGDRHGAGSERLDDEAEFGEKRRRVRDEARLALRHLDDRRHEQRLPLRGAAGAGAFKAFIDEALMGGVLVDDDQPVARLRHDIGLMDLRPRRAERGLAVRARGLEIIRARLRIHVLKRPLAGPLESRLRRLVETGVDRRRIARRRVVRGRGGRAPPVPVRRPVRSKVAPREKIEGGRAICRRRAVQRAGKRLFQGADDEAAHQAAVAKAHLRLGRMHIDVDLMRIAGDEQRQRRMAAGGQKIHVSRPHRAKRAACRAQGAR